MNVLHLRGPRHALLWSLWRTNWRQLLTRIGFGCVYVLILLGASKVGMQSEEAAVLHGILMLVLTFFGVSAQSWISQLDRTGSGLGYRDDFVRPVSTVCLVSMPVLFTLVTCASCYAIPAGLFQLWSGMDLPFIGPVTLICCAVMWLIAASWSAVTTAGRAAGVIVVITIMVTLAVHRLQTFQEPWVMAIGNREFFTFEWYEYAMLLVSAVGAFLCTVVAVARQRCGETLLGTSWLDVFRLRPIVSSVDQRQDSRTLVEFGSPFATPMAAQLWYEYRRVGRRTLLIGLLAPFAVAAFVLSGRLLGFDPGGADRAWMIALLVSPVVYQVIGIDGAVGLRPVRGVLEFPVFDAARAISSDRLVEVKVIMVTMVSLAAWGLMAAAAGGYSLLFGLTDQSLLAARDLVGFINVEPAWLLILEASSCLLGTAAMTSVLLVVWMWMPLHQRLVTCISLSAVGLTLLMVWDSRSGWRLLPLWRVLGYVVPILVSCVCLSILFKAFIRGVCFTRMFIVGAAGWLTFACSVVFILSRLSIPTSVEIPGQAIVAAGTALLAPLCTLAAAPLALNQHRHQ